MVTASATIFDEESARPAAELASMLEQHLRLIFADLLEDNDISWISL